MQASERTLLFDFPGKSFRDFSQISEIVMGFGTAVVGAGLEAGATVVSEKHPSGARQKRLATKKFFFTIRTS